VSRFERNGFRARSRAAARLSAPPHPPTRRPSTAAGAVSSAIRRCAASLAPRLLWGRRNQDAGAALKDTNLTQFAPDVFAGLYVSLFMFSGEHSVEYVQRERLYLIRLQSAFRNRLPPGQFPYPFWHDEAKWGVYQAANCILLWVDPKTAKDRRRAIHRARRPRQRGRRHATPEPQIRRQLDVDGQGGPHQPRSHALRRPVPAGQPLSAKARLHLPDPGAADARRAMRKLHMPHNPYPMRRLLIMHTPAHAAGENRAADEGGARGQDAAR